MKEQVFISPRQAGKALAMELAKHTQVTSFTETDMETPLMSGPPDRLSIEVDSEDYHPSCCRVGVVIDGKERNDIAFYDIKTGAYKTEHNTSHLAKSIKPYWRYDESRQQRRARERWEAKRRKRA